MAQIKTNQYSIADDAITLAKMASGTDGNIITYDASGNPAVVASGTSGQFLKSQGADTVPVFAAASSALSSKLITGTRTDAEGSGAESITGAGFAPTAVIVISAVQYRFWGIGLGDSTPDDACWGARGDYTNNEQMRWDAARIIRFTSGTTLRWQATLDSMDADGCTITFDEMDDGGGDLDYALLFLR